MAPPSARISLVSVLSVTMAAATFALVAYGVLAENLIAEFGIARWQVGLLVTANSLMAGFLSPAVGRVTDRVGARRATVACLAGAAVGLGAFAIAPTYPVLVGFALVAGVFQAVANPATNKLISQHVAQGRRGIITGIKQSGVQAGIFVGGLALPALAVGFGWRAAVAVFAAAFFTWAVYAGLALPSDPAASRTVGQEEHSELPPLIMRLAVYGFLLGAGGTAVTTFIPLFAEEQLGFTSTLAGAAVALVGLTGIGSRILWGRAAETVLTPERALALIAASAVLSPVVLIFSQSASWLVWPGAVLVGLSASSWNSVGMLAVIDAVPVTAAGRGSGIVLAGFLSGLAVGAPAMGWSVDQWGTYTPGWLVVAAVFGLAIVVIRRD